MANSIKDVMDAINDLTELVSDLSMAQKTTANRLFALENQTVKTTAKPSTNHKRKKSNGGAAKLNQVFNDVTPEGSKYRMVSAWYVIDGQEPYEKKFYGLKKMAKYDWGLGKLHGSFKKYTDLPTV